MPAGGVLAWTLAPNYTLVRMDLATAWAQHQKSQKGRWWAPIEDWLHNHPISLSAAPKRAAALPLTRASSVVVLVDQVEGMFCI